MVTRSACTPGPMGELSHATSLTLKVHDEFHEPAGVRRTLLHPEGEIPTTSTTEVDRGLSSCAHTLQIIKAVLGVTPKCFRAPYGDTDNRIRFITAALNMTTILWSNDTFDWEVSLLRFFFFFFYRFLTSAFTSRSCFFLTLPRLEQRVSTRRRKTLRTTMARSSPLPSKASTRPRALSSSITRSTTPR